MQALLTMFTAEHHLNRQISKQEMLDGTLGALLTDEDFTEASNVSNSLPLLS